MEWSQVLDEVLLVSALVSFVSSIVLIGMVIWSIWGDNETEGAETPLRTSKKARQRPSMFLLHNLARIIVLNLAASDIFAGCFYVLPAAPANTWLCNLRAVLGLFPPITGGVWCIVIAFSLLYWMWVKTQFSEERELLGRTRRQLLAFFVLAWYVFCHPSS